MKKKEERQVQEFNKKVMHFKENPSKAEWEFIKAFYNSLSSDMKFLVDFRRANTIGFFLENDFLHYEDIVDHQIRISHCSAFNESISLERKRQSFFLAKDMYDELIVDDQKHSKLLDEIDEEIKRLERIEVLKIEASYVSSLIAKLEMPVYLEDNDFFTVYEAVSKLNPDALPYVENYEHFLAVQKRISQLEAALALDTLIVSLPKEITLDDYDDVIDLHTSASEMDLETLSFVNHLDFLNQCYKEVLELKKIEDDKAMALIVEHQISASRKNVFAPGILLQPKKELLNLAYTMFDSLSCDQKNFVGNDSLFMEMEDEIKRLEKKEHDLQVAKKIYNEINEIPISISIDNYDTLTGLENKYMVLEDFQKEMVTNYEILENALEIVRAMKRALDVSQKIDLIDSDIDYAFLVLDEYEALDSLAKGYVHNHLHLRKKITSLNEKKELISNALQINERILNIPSCITLKDEEAICLLKNDFDLLGEEKVYVDKYYLLNNAIKCIEELKINKRIESLFMDLDNPLSLKNYFVIESLYNLALNVNSGMIESFDLLEDTYKQLEALIDEAKRVSSLIDSIHDNEDFKTAKMHYDLLDAEQKTFIHNYGLLISYEKNQNKKSWIDESLDKKEFVDDEIMVLEEIMNSDVNEERKRDCIIAVNNLYESLDNDQKNNINLKDYLIGLKKEVL